MNGSGITHQEDLLYNVYNEKTGKYKGAIALDKDDLKEKNRRQITGRRKGV